MIAAEKKVDFVKFRSIDLLFDKLSNEPFKNMIEGEMPP